MSIKRSILCIVILAFSTSDKSFSETLRDVKSSQAMRKVEMDLTKYNARVDTDRRKQQSWLTGMDPNSNFASIWANSAGPLLLLSWAGAHIPDYKQLGADGTRSREFVNTHVFLRNNEGVKVKLDIFVPHPTYRTMVKLRTITELNKLEPPRLQVVAKEELPINNLNAMYYRSVSGECSLLFKISQLSVVNLSVKRCENSNVMMDIAKSLDLTRLSKKLDT